MGSTVSIVRSSRCRSMLLPLFLLLATALPAQEVYPTNGRTYFLSDDAMPIALARAYAAVVPGGYLLSVTDAAEEQWVIDTFDEREQFWLGISEEITEGVWLWDSGEPLAYENICPQDPCCDQDFLSLSVGYSCPPISPGWRRSLATSGFWAIVETDLPILAGVSTPLQTGQDPVAIEWTLPLAYTAIDVYRDGVLVATLPGTATGFVESAAPGWHTYFMQGWVGASAAVPRTIRTSTPTAGDDYVLSIDAGAALSGSSARVPVRATNAAGLPAWGFAVCHDPALVDGIDIELGPVWGEAISLEIPSFYSVIIDVGGMSAGVVVDFAIGQLPPGAGWPIHELVYETAQPGVEFVTPLRFCTNFGWPVIQNVVVVAGQSVIPLLEHGSVASGLVGFTRGDCNRDGVIDIADPVAALDHLFGGAAPPCPEACEQNGDSALDIADPVAGLGYLFASGPPPSPPFPECSADPDPTGSIGCAAAPGCP